MPRLPIILALGVLCIGLASAASCPPAGFDAFPNLDIVEYIRAPWYVQEQVPLLYQKEDSLFCVRATYTAIDPAKPQDGVRVANYANKLKVNGESMGNSGGLVALPEASGQTVFGKAWSKVKSWFGSKPAPPSPSQGSKLEVGPEAISGIKIIRSLVFGPYWVVAAGVDPTTNEYTWAVISGGAPKYSSDNGCSTFIQHLPTTLQYTGGLWLFTRKQVDPEGAAAARAAAVALGFDVSELLPVQQEGCLYNP